MEDIAGKILNRILKPGKDKKSKSNTLAMHYGKCPQCGKPFKTQSYPDIITRTGPPPLLCPKCNYVGGFEGTMSDED